MKDVLIHLESVSVCYPLEPLVEGSIKDIIVALFSRRAIRVGTVEANRKVSLDLSAGDRLGIIGANGAGIRTIAGIYPVPEGRVGEIIEFSGLGQFTDLPMKSYSAGMQVRLAFAISTAIESEVPLIDEVISAGDMELQHRARASVMIDKAHCMVIASHDITAFGVR